MKNILLIIFFLFSFASYAQVDYYAPSSKTHVMTKKESREARRKERQARKLQSKWDKAKSKKHCYCPYQKSTTVLQDVWNTGIVGTGKGIYQSTVKPQVLGKVVGAAQGAANRAPVPSLVAGTVVTMVISQVNKARRHQRKGRSLDVGKNCNCDPCPYHSVK